MAQTIGVLGLGIFGSTIAKELGRHHHNVIAIDCNEENVNRIDPYISQGIVGDFTQYDLLKEVAIEQCDQVVIAAGTSLEACVLAIMHLKELGVRNITAKSKNQDYMKIMKELGATRVIRPEYEMGLRTARKIMKPRLMDIIDLDDKTSIIEFKPPRDWVGRTLSNLKLRQTFSLNVIGLKDSSSQKRTYQVDPNEVINEDTILIVIGDSNEIENFRLD